MTKENGQSPSTEAEVRAILADRYPNDRRLQRAMIRLAELDPKGRYTSMLDTADPAFQRIVPQPEASGAEPVALKAEPLVMTSSTEAGPKADKPATGPKAK